MSISIFEYARIYVYKKIKLWKIYYTPRNPINDQSPGIQLHFVTFWDPKNPAVLKLPPPEPRVVFDPAALLTIEKRCKLRYVFFCTNKMM
jgi:hypothetical protein